MVALVSALFSFGRGFPDSTLYREYSLFILGKSPTFDETVAMRPMLPLISSIISLLIGDLDLSYALANTAFGVLGTLVSYKLGKSIFKSEETGVLAAVLYATSPTMLWFGAAVLVDTPAYFFIGLVALLALEPIKQIQPRWRTFLQETVAAMGILFKESVVFALLFLLLARFRQRRGFKTALASILLAITIEAGILAFLSLDPLVFVRKFLLAKQYSSSYEYSTWGIIPLVKSFINAFSVFPRDRAIYSVSDSGCDWISICKVHTKKYAHCLPSFSLS